MFRSNQVVTDVGDRHVTKHTKVHAQQPTFIESSSPYTVLKVNPYCLNQLPPGQQAKSCLYPQQSGPALQLSILVKLHN